MSFQVPSLTGETWWECRDEFIGTKSGFRTCATAAVRNQIANKKGMPKSFDVKIHSLSPQGQERLDKFGRLIWMAARGATNRGFTPFHSPFTARWFIGVLRNTANNQSHTLKLTRMPNRLTIVDSRAFIEKEFDNFKTMNIGAPLWASTFYKMMLEADVEKVRMQRNRSLAWDIPWWSNSGASSNLSNGNLSGLMGHKHALKPTHNYAVMFPPSQFIKGVR